MNNSNKRDVQDLIAEFVSSKNQLLHEEIISSIKRESFTNQFTEEEKQPETLAETTLPLAQEQPHVQEQPLAQDLEQKIAELTARNNELQQELTMLQMQESQTIASTKPIGADDLRMEFLNFTSAHIQQFNTRIKRTEELIESQLMKQQQPADQKLKKEYPGWLIKANLVLLGLVSVYLIYLAFFQSPSGNAPDAQAETEVSAQPNPATHNPAPQTAEPQPKNEQALPEQETPASSTTFTATAATTEPGSTPFRKAGASDLPAAEQTVMPTLPKQNLTPSPAKDVTKPSATTAQNPIEPVQVTKKVNAAPAIQKPLPVSPGKSPLNRPAAEQPTGQKNKTIAANNPVPVKSTPNQTTKANTEKKSNGNEKVYFGED